MKKTIIIAGIIGVLAAPSVTLAYGGISVAGTIGANGPVVAANYSAETYTKLLKIYRDLLAIKVKLLELQVKLRLRHG